MKMAALVAVVNFPNAATMLAYALLGEAVAAGGTVSLQWIGRLEPDERYQVSAPDWSFFTGGGGTDIRGLMDAINGHAGPVTSFRTGHYPCGDLFVDFGRVEVMINRRLKRRDNR